MMVFLVGVHVALYGLREEADPAQVLATYLGR